MADIDYAAVRKAQRQERTANFRLIEPLLRDMRKEAMEYVQKYVNEHYVPRYSVTDCSEWPESCEPHLVFDFDFIISDSFRFRVHTKLEIITNGDIRCFLNVCLDMDDLAMNGSVYLAATDFDKYNDKVKEACDACLNKYNELHEKMRDRFF